MQHAWGLLWVVVVAWEFHDNVILAKELLRWNVTAAIRLRELGLWKVGRMRWRHGHLVWLCGRWLGRSVIGFSPVGWVVCGEFTIFHHALEDTGVEKLGFLDEALHHLFGSSLGFLFDEADHGHVALDLNVLAQIQALGWRTKPQLSRLWWLPWLVSANLPFISQVDTGWRICVCLEAPWHIVEASVELDCAAA